MSRRTRRIGILDVSDAIGSMFKAYGNQVNEVVDDAMKAVADDAVEQLRRVRTFSPQGDPTGDYSKDWELMIRPVKRYTREYVVYNEDHYQLTHLLESGHAKMLWGRDSGETVQGYEHIRPVNDRVQDELVREIVERITDLNTV